jgi:hypothetical protein
MGDLWWDFGWPGVVIGAILFGLLARIVAGLVRDGGGAAGREYRVVLYSIALVVLYMELITTYSVALGFVITFILPFLFAMHVVGPFSAGIARRLGEARGQSRATA